jgi:hypothetical protein
MNRGFGQYRAGGAVALNDPKPMPPGCWPNASQKSSGCGCAWRNHHRPTPASASTPAARLNNPSGSNI